jgi:4-hydroxyproline epimerase
LQKLLVVDSVPFTSIQVIDSHTAGEPTRVVVAGGPDLGRGSLADRARRLAAEQDAFRSAVVNEPRGSDVLVGALLCEPEARDSAAAVIFFNNVGYLGMCGHGTIGVVTTLAYQGRIGCGEHRIETPVGTVRATLHADGRVSIENVPAFRYRGDVTVDVPGMGTVTGEIAWGGNWFFLVENPPLPLTHANADRLTEHAWNIRQALKAAGITGSSGAEIDHIELSSPSPSPGAHSRNFVLCPGKAYDRSPCGTGTSAKLACLAAAGKLAQGERWRQEGILGSVFEASYQLRDGAVIPSITGKAWITGEARLVFDPDDPFRSGIRL